VPEGDTIHYHANRIRPVLEGRVPESVETLHRRFARDRWAERLGGQAVRRVDAHGKHLFIRFANGLVIHSHLRMSGKWRVRDPDYPLPRNTWLVIRTPEKLVAQINGPVLELMTESRTRFDQRIAGLGPDILAPELDEEAILRRLRTDDPTRPIGDALLDQRILAGIGNLWKCEGCFQARVDPWRRTGDVSDEEVLDILRETRPRMQQSARDGMQDKFRVIYGIAGQPCPRCGERSTVLSRGQGDDNRVTYWCPRCQH
jgi:endonuclease-8